jgi:hypothetical protein
VIDPDKTPDCTATDTATTIVGPAPISGILARCTGFAVPGRPQCVLTILMASWVLGEQVSAEQWLGLLLTVSGLNL